MYIATSYILRTPQDATATTWICDTFVNTCSNKIVYSKTSPENKPIEELFLYNTDRFFKNCLFVHLVEAPPKTMIYPRKFSFTNDMLRLQIGWGL